MSLATDILKRSGLAPLWVPVLLMHSRLWNADIRHMVA